VLTLPGTQPMQSMTPNVMQKALGACSAPDVSMGGPGGGGGLGMAVAVTSATAPNSLVQALSVEEPK
jgi:hypothetical protein